MCLCVYGYTMFTTEKHSVIKLPEIGEKDIIFSAYTHSEKHVDTLIVLEKQSRYCRLTGSMAEDA